MTSEEKMKSGALYRCDSLEPALEAKLAECRDLLYEYNHTRPIEVERRTEIIRMVFAEAKGDFLIEPPLNANRGCNTHIGENFIPILI